MFYKKWLFVQEKDKDIFVKMKSKNDEGLDFLNWVFNDFFNQITLKIINISLQLIRSIFHP